MMKKAYRKKPVEGRFWSKVKKTKTCWLWVRRMVGQNSPVQILLESGDFTNLATTQSELGRRFGVYQTTISDIINNKRWKINA